MTYQIRRTVDGSDTLFSTAYGQVYHSIFGALTETNYVFIQGAGVEERLARGQPTRILEVGFGTGLNFFVTAHLAQMTQTPLHYVALEKTLLPHELLSQLNHGQLLDEGNALRETFLTWRIGLPNPLPTKALRWAYASDSSLDLILGDATTIDIPLLSYHAVYHDAFSPEANPELWTADYFARLYAVMAKQGILATYSVKGAVRRALQAAGFRVKKRPGPPGKREVLTAVRLL